MERSGLLEPSDGRRDVDHGCSGKRRGQLEVLSHTISSSHRRLRHLRQYPWGRNSVTSVDRHFKCRRLQGDSSSRLTTTLTVRGDRERHQCADDPGHAGGQFQSVASGTVLRNVGHRPAPLPRLARGQDTPDPARRLAQHLGNIVRAATYRAAVRRHPEGHPADPADRRGPRDPLTCPQGRASSTRLNGVSVARRKRPNPASAAIAPSRCWPACAPRPSATGWSSDDGVHTSVEAA